MKQKKDTTLSVATEVDLSQTVDTAEAAAFLGCSVPLIYAMLRDGRLSRKEEVGNRIYVYTEDLQKLLDQKKVNPRKKVSEAPAGLGLLTDPSHQVSIQFLVNAGDYQVLQATLASHNLNVTQWLSMKFGEAVSEIKSVGVKISSAS